MANRPTKNPKEPKDPVLVEISKGTLEELLKSKGLAIGKNVRVIKALEISPGSVIAKQYDR
jgi:hypothetical protein